MPLAPTSTRLRAIALYKELHRLGRDYPDPSYDFHGRMRRLFENNKNLTEPEDIERAIQLGEFIRNETLALIRLSKYRHLKRSYPERMPELSPPSSSSQSSSSSSSHTQDHETTTRQMHIPNPNISSKPAPT